MLAPQDFVYFFRCAGGQTHQLRVIIVKLVLNQIDVIFLYDSLIKKIIFFSAWVEKEQRRDFLLNESQSIAVNIPLVKSVERIRFAVNFFLPINRTQSK